MTDEDRWHEVNAKLDALEILIGGSLLDLVEAGALDGATLISSLRGLEADYRRTNEHEAAIRIFRETRKALEKYGQPSPQDDEP